MWDLPGPGLEPVSPALAGGFLTTAPPGKSFSNSFKVLEILVLLISSSIERTNYFSDCESLFLIYFPNFLVLEIKMFSFRNRNILLPLCLYLFYFLNFSPYMCI